MENINYIKDGEYLTGYKDENDIGVLNRPVHELSQHSFHFPDLRLGKSNRL